MRTGAMGKDDPPTHAFDLGVLFVHGIGTQPSGDTMAHWGDVFLDAINRGTANKVIATVERACRKGPDDSPASCEVSLQHGAHREHWLIAEGYWAEAFPPPSYSELVSWSVRA